RSKATFSTYAPRKRIHTKNENALIFEVHSLENISTTDIVEAMVTKVGEDLIA
ncbi:11757_t:CDS:1, partial [Gigaspora rosea]